MIYRPKMKTSGIRMLDMVRTIFDITVI